MTWVAILVIVLIIVTIPRNHIVHKHYQLPDTTYDIKAEWQAHAEAQARLAFTRDQCAYILKIKCGHEFHPCTNRCECGMSQIDYFANVQHSRAQATVEDLCPCHPAFIRLCKQWAVDPKQAAAARYKWRTQEVTQL